VARAQPLRRFPAAQRCVARRSRADRVLIALPNGPEFLTVFYGTQRAGAVPVPLAPDSGGERLADIAGHARARALELTRHRAERLDEATRKRLASLGPKVLDP
jgi:acyl-CoA synthetase (AMP-forming)/AMP-acid ligase II